MSLDKNDSKISAEEARYLSKESIKFVHSDLFEEFDNVMEYLYRRIRYCSKNGGSSILASPRDFLSKNVLGQLDNLLCEPAFRKELIDNFIDKIVFELNRLGYDVTVDDDRFISVKW